MILVAIAAFNESAHIQRVVEDAWNYADKVLVVDDGSSDYTSEFARRGNADVLIHPHNMGMGQAMRTIFNYAKTSLEDSDVLVTLDGDGQHFPEDIPRLIEKMAEGYDVVNGSRLFSGLAKQTSELRPYRRIVNGAATYATRALSGYEITDSQSGFKAYRDWVVKRMRLVSTDMAWNSESWIRLRAMKAKVGEVPIRTVWTPPSSGRKPNGFIYGVKVLGRLCLVRVGAL